MSLPTLRTAPLRMAPHRPAPHRPAPHRTPRLGAGLRSPVAPAGAGALLLAGACLMVLLTSAAVVLRPTMVVLALAGAAALGALMLRIEWTVMLYVAAEPFGDYLTTLSSASMKLVGALVFAAWLLRLIVTPRPVALRHPAVYAAGGLLLVLLVSTVASDNGAAGAEVLTRYLSYLIVLVVLVDTMRTALAPRRVATAFVLSCTASTVVGLIVFLSSGGGRAAGPMQDANDFAFYLICAVPLALMLWRDAGRWRWVYPLAAVLLTLTTLTTFSRGGMLGLAAMAVVAGLLGLLRARLVLAGAVAVVIAALLLTVAAPALVERSLAEKQHVAAANVSSRFTTWTLAAEMTADRPLIGQGPGGFHTHALSYADRTVPDVTHLDVVHQMYLDVASELGLLGLGAFVTMIGAGVSGALRAARRRGAGAVRPGVVEGADANLGAAVVVSFAGVLVAASFLSEQYYLPVWLLVALGVALDPWSREEDRRCASSS